MKFFIALVLILIAGFGVYRYGPFHKAPSTQEADSRPALPPPPAEDPPIIDAIQSSLRNKESEARIATLLSGGANANSIDKTGRPALSLAVRNNDPEAVEALLKAGADANFRDREMQWTPLMNAAFQAARDPAFLKVTETLLTHGADVHAQKEGTTALNVAINNLDATKHEVRIIELLLKHGANPNGEAAPAGGYTLTPILAAIIAGKTDATLALIKGGASLDPGKGAKLYSQTARDNKHPELATVLEKLEKTGKKNNRNR